MNISNLGKKCQPLLIPMGEAQVIELPTEIHSPEKRTFQIQTMDTVEYSCIMLFCISCQSSGNASQDSFYFLQNLMREEKRSMSKATDLKVQIG